MTPSPSISGIYNSLNKYVVDPYTITVGESIQIVVAGSNLTKEYLQTLNVEVKWNNHSILEEEPVWIYDDYHDCFYFTYEPDSLYYSSGPMKYIVGNKTLEIEVKVID